MPKVSTETKTIRLPRNDRSGRGSEGLGDCTGFDTATEGSGQPALENKPGYAAGQVLGSKAVAANRNVKAVPLPSSLATSMEPPICFTMP